MTVRRIRSARLGAGLVVLAVALTVLGVPLASAQGTTIFVRNATSPIPTDDPWAAAWDGIVATDIALSAQSGVVPNLVVPTITSVGVRALRDEGRVSILVEWADPTRDESTLRSNLFADQVAIQFAEGTGISICMGQQAGAIDVWLWKADWAADLAGGTGLTVTNPNMPTDEMPPLAPAAPATTPAASTTQATPAASPAGSPTTGGPTETSPPVPPGFMTARDAGNPRAAAQRPSSVEDLNAVGFGSLTPQPAARQNVHGASDYRDGRWRVIFTRDLEPDDLSDAIIDPRATTVAALAVWDGANGDRDGRKAVSSWLALAFETPPVGPLDSWPFWLMLILALGGSGFVLWLGARQPATGAGWPASVLQPAPPTQDRSPSPVSAAGPDGDGAGRQPPAGGAASA